MQTQSTTKTRWPRWTLALGIAAACIAALISGWATDDLASARRPESTSVTPPVQSSFLYRFDPTSPTFFTFPLTLGSVPYGVAVTGTNPTHVWVAEYGLNQIGHLAYTNTGSFSYITYPVTSTVNSGPYRLAVQGNSVWFTERGANRIGRLDVTSGVIDEFSSGLSPNSGLADIRVAPNGWVWASGQSSSRLIRLVVTSTADYEVREYPPHPTMVGIFGLSVPASEYVWYASPGAGVIGRLDVVNNVVNDVSFFFPQPRGTPYEIVTTGSFAWFTDPQRDRLGQFDAQTLGNLVLYTSTSTMKPAGLAVEASNVLWFTQQDEHGAVGRFVYTTTTSTRFDSFALPIAGLRPTGIAVAVDKSVWFAAFVPVRVFLPAVLKESVN